MPNSNTSSMRVGQVLGSFGGGGAQRLAYNLAVALGPRVERSYAVAVREAGHYASDEEAGITLVQLGAQHGSPLRLLSGMRRLRSVVRRERIDVLHVHGTSSLPFVVLATRAMLRPPRIVFTWQDSENVLTATGWTRRRMIWALRRCASVSGSSRKVADQLAPAAGLAHVGIFHGGVPLTERPPGGSGLPSVLWLGRMVPPKDPIALVQAAARLRAEGLDFRVTLVGKPIPTTVHYFEQTQALIESEGLSDTVRAPGFVPDDELITLTRASDIGVQTSHTEGLSIALMEQMMAGLAIVATDVGDTATAIRHEESGLLVPPRDPEALAGALRRLLTDPDLRERLGEGARRAAVERYSLQAMAARALDEYERVLGSPA